MKRYLPDCLILALALSLPSAFFGQPVEKQFDQLLMKKFKAEEPGGTALVVKSGRVIYRKAFGKANLELDVDMKPENIFRIGSITKQFTASAILKLAEEGKLNLQDDITKYIKDYPTHGHTITIEQLMNHTSGIKSLTEIEEVTPEMMKLDRTSEEIIDLFKKEPMDFTPGEQYHYNNSAYILLGYIIEILTGTTYENHIDSVFFQPLGMLHSFYGSTSRIIKNRAAGYQKQGGEFENADFMSMTLPHSAGALLSNVDDLYTWYHALMNDKVISKESRIMAHTPTKLSNGKTIGYGYGWVLGNVQGSPMISHGGGINGYLTSSLYLPDEEVFVAVFSNCNCNPPGDLGIRMAAIAIGKPFVRETIEMPEEILLSYVGVYDSEFDGERIISHEDGNLYSQRSGGSRFKILPFEKDKFCFEETLNTLEFIRNDQGKIISVVLKGTSLPVTWRLTDKPLPE